MKNPRVYGPVPSRRFGLSLGVDVVPFKVCCYDCVYCQLGPTTDLTIERRDFFPRQEILADVKKALEHGPAPDVITLAGSGEPTLYASLGDLISSLREISAVPILVLTNGGLFFKQDVAEDVLAADMIAPSLDAGDPETFRRINRPHEAIDFEEMVSGLADVVGRYDGQVRLEVMLVEGVNDSSGSIQALAECIRRIGPEGVDINLPVRPVPKGEIHASNERMLREALDAFGPTAKVVAEYSNTDNRGTLDDESGERILQMLARRPCTIEDLHASLGLQRNEIIKVVDAAMSTGKVNKRSGEAGDYFYLARS